MAVDTHLVIGASGQVGYAVLQAATRRGGQAVGTYHETPLPGLRQLDVLAPENLQRLFDEFRPAIVYLTAAQPNVDFCELHPDETYPTNVAGVRNVVRCANDAGAKLVYFSSDYVFDGRNGPYSEDDTVDPICAYGRQKVFAEHYVAAYSARYLIVRTTVVYGWEHHGKNFIYRLLGNIRDGRPIRVPIDQIGNPTYAPNLADAVVDLALGPAEGIYHVAGPNLINRYDFACAAADAFGQPKDMIEPVTTQQLAQAALRPLKAGMIVAKAASQLSVPLLGYREGLKAMASERNTSI